MKTSLFWSLLALCVGISTACGKQDDPSSQSIPNPDNYKSGSCGSQIVSDIGNIRLNCLYLSTQEEIDSCKVTIIEFKNKYPGINCQATQVNTKEGLTKEKLVTINEQWVQDLLAYYSQS